LNHLRAGFTLIELMVVVAVLGLSITIVFLKVDAILPGTRLEAACKNIVTDLELLRSYAIFKGLPIYLEYDSRFNSYRAFYPVDFDENGDVVGAGETEIFEPKPVGKSVEIEDVALGFYDGKKNSPGSATICIRPDGSLTGHIVHLKNTDTGKEMSVRIASLTGFAEVLKGKVGYEEVGDESF